MMIIEDEELRGIFKVASEEHLQKLDAGLLHLEKHPDDQAMLEELLREAHSLKGDANMLGVKDVGTLAHQIEHLLTKVKTQEETLSVELCDRFAHAIAAIAKLVHEAVTGDPAEVDPFRVLAELMGATPAPTEPEPTHPKAIESENHTIAAIPELVTPELVTPEPDLSESTFLESDAEPDIFAELDSIDQDVTTEQSHDLLTPASAVGAVNGVVNGVVNGIVNGTDDASILPNGKDNKTYPSYLLDPLPEAPQNLPFKSQPSSTDSYRIETIRVATRNLDNLMTQAGELTVTKIRVAHRLAEIETIANLWEEWSRDLFTNRFVLEEVQHSNNAIHRLETLHNRIEERLEQLGVLVKTLRNALYEDTTRLELIGDELEEGIRTLRLLPLSTIFNLFPRMVRDLARQEG
ncbi:MAG TPA: Hpt domain-containing protein, partial [Allocoleopsis sp.]